VGNARPTSVEEVPQAIGEPRGGDTGHQLDASDLLCVHVTPAPEDESQRHAIRHGEDRVIDGFPQFGRTLGFYGGMYVGQTDVASRVTLEREGNHSRSRRGHTDSMNRMSEDAFLWQRSHHWFVSYD
jgi:hypothetical protein